MVQYIDTEYKERATSAPLNKRFRDITGPTVLSGFRLALGSDNFSISLVKGDYTSSIAITPSGARVEEDADVLDAIVIPPNELNAGNPRVDSVYLVYQFGTEGVPASYQLITGTGGNVAPAQNPNPKTHLLLGYVNVPPLGAPPTAADLQSVPMGIHSLEVANSARFHGPATFEEEVVFESPVRFLNGATGAQDPNASFMQKLAYPIIAEPGQQEFTLPSAYTPKKDTLQVYKDWVPQPPSAIDENSPTTFRFHDPLNGGEKIWATWIKNIALYTPETHEHDNLYFRKNEVNNRSLQHIEDFFGGTDGRVLRHYLGTTNYVVIPPVPTDKAADVGEISVEKRANEIIVYNTGTYRGKFDLAYYVKQSYQYVPNNEDIGFFDITSSDLDEVTFTYRQVDYKRSDGTLYLRTVLENYDARGYYRRMRLEFYNTAGSQIINTQRYALDYDVNGLLYSRVLIPNEPAPS